MQLLKIRNDIYKQLIMECIILYITLRSKNIFNRKWLYTRIHVKFYEKKNYKRARYRVEYPISILWL